MTQNINPLQRYFRQPAIYLRLPSDGRFWKDGALEMPQNRELPVYPMTAVDEITYRTPDALFSGQAVIDVIQSCIPAIKNAWSIPTVDLTAVFVAIRIASYGHNIDVGVTCPACQNTDDYSLDLRSVIDQLKCPDYNQKVNYGDLEIVFRSMDYEQQNRINVQQFENQRMINLIPESDLEDQEKLNQMAQVMKNITRLTVEALKYSVASIRTPDAIVSEPEFIDEFLNNCDRQVFDQIRDTAVKLRQETEIRPLQITCQGCSHQYEQQINLDTASFFGPAS
jgi:hypothetical protein